MQSSQKRLAWLGKPSKSQRRVLEALGSPPNDFSSSQTTKFNGPISPAQFHRLLVNAHFLLLLLLLLLRLGNAASRWPSRTSGP